MLGSVLAAFGVAPPLHAQVPANITSNLFPLVVVSRFNPTPPGSPLAVGVFDTGSDTLHVPPQTNTLFGIPVTYTDPAPASPEFTPDSIVGGTTNITIGGWLGGSFGGPEINGTAPWNQQAHVFATDSRRSAVQGLERSAGAPSLTYFKNANNKVFSMVNVGMSVVSSDRQSDDQQRLVFCGQ
jgi:hypothetical protein